MHFSSNDYRRGLAKGLYCPPASLRPYTCINRAAYRALAEAQIRDGRSVEQAMDGLRSRLSTRYYGEIYRVQTGALSFSERSFPGYRFILPEVLADDWLAIVDWRNLRRDHSIHQPLTAYVVDKLLRGGGDPSQRFQPNGQPLLTQCVNVVLSHGGAKYLTDFVQQLGLSDKSFWLNRSSVGRVQWETLITETAYLAALFHDLGYPWQYVGGLDNALAHADYLYGVPATDASCVIEGFENRLLFCPLNGYRLWRRGHPATWQPQLKELVGRSLVRTHGLPGAIGFLYLNDILCDFPRRTPAPIRQFCLEWAATAIMLHDMVGIYWGKKDNALPAYPHLRLRFSADPLSSIVALADVIEDFSRPRLRSHPSSDAVCMRYQSLCEYTELAYNDVSGKLTITYWFKNKSDLNERKTSMGWDSKGYFHPHHGYLDLSAIGVQEVELAARVVPKSSPP